MGELLGIARLKFHDGKLGEFKRLSAQAMEIARAQDTGTLEYAVYLNDDQSEAIVIERYKDDDGLIQHGAHLGDLSAEILATASVTGELLGEPNPTLRALLAGGPVQVFSPFLSM